MKNQFKILLLMLITSWSINAQKHDVYNMSFDAQNIKILDLDLDGTYVGIEESKDDKIYFEYSIEFDNYSKKEIEKQLEDINTSAQIVEDKLIFKTSSTNVLSDVVYSIESLFGITFEGNNISFKEPTNKHWRKSKQYFYSLNDGSKIKSLKEYLKNLKGLDGKGGTKKIEKKNVKTLKTNFIIKLPSDIDLRVVAVNSHLTFKFDLTTQVNINSRNTNLMFMGITNPLNNFDIVNGKFKSNELDGGAYKFNHLSDVQIAEVQNLTIDSEFSTMKIGEVGEHVRIVDFNGKFWIHNFSENFKNFQMDTEYSEINVFYPEDNDFFLTTFGHDTVHYTDNLITKISPSKKNESSKMMIMGKETNLNKIQINAVHGIIRFGKDFIELGE